MQTNPVTLTQTQMDLLSQYNGYQATVTDNTVGSPTYGQQIANPVTQADFINEQIIKSMNDKIQEMFNRNLVNGGSSGTAPLIA